MTTQTMPAAGPEPQSDLEQLLEEAVALQRLQQERPGDAALQARISQWRANSPQHEARWQQAERYWQASAELRPQRENAFNRFRLALEIELERVAEAYRGRTLVAALPVLVLGLMLGFGYLVLFPGTVSSPSPDIAVIDRPATLDYASPPRETREVRLSDGSILALNWDTRLSVRMTQQRREVTLLRGEARFRVTGNPERPFVVRAGNTSATALGTSYSVRTMADGAAEVVVEEGRVEVSAGDGSTRQLIHDQQIRITGSTLGSTEQIDAATALAWTEGLLIFSKRPLTEVLQELGRYTSRPLELAALDSDRRSVTATYFTARADDALQLIAAGFDLQLQPDVNGSITVLPDTRR